MLFAGTLCCGFGRGKFKARSNAEMENTNTDVDVLYELESSETQVVFNNQLTTLGKVYYDKLKTLPDAKLNYYNIKAAPPSPTNIVCTMSVDALSFSTY